MNPIEKLKRIRGVTYNWNSKYDPILTEERKYGVIAQEVRKVFPTMVSKA